MEKSRPSASLLTMLAIIGRLLPHPPNFTPVSGASLFGGAKLGRPWNYLLPIGVMGITDIFLGLHQTMPYVYVSFLLIAWLGERFLSKKSSLGKVASLSMVGSLAFYLITNFGVWQVGGLYPHTVAGLLESYAMGLPFLRWTVLGDLTYSVGFFAIFEWAQNRETVKKFDKFVASWLSWKSITN